MECSKAQSFKNIPKEGALATKCYQTIVWENPPIKIWTRKIFPFKSGISLPGSQKYPDFNGISQRSSTNADESEITGSTKRFSEKLKEREKKNRSRSRKSRKIKSFLWFWTRRVSGRAGTLLLLLGEGAAGRAHARDVRGVRGGRGRGIGHVSSGSHGPGKIGAGFPLCAAIGRQITARSRDPN